MLKNMLSLKAERSLKAGRQRTIGFICCAAFFMLLTPRSEVWAADTSSAQAAKELITQAEQIKEKKEALKAEKEKKPEITVEKEAAPLPAAAGPSFAVKKILLDGNTVVSESDLAPLISPYEGRTISAADLAELSKKITDVYRAQGYITSYAYAPPQKIEKIGADEACPAGYEDAFAGAVGSHGISLWGLVREQYSRASSYKSESSRISSCHYYSGVSN